MNKATAIRTRPRPLPTAPPADVAVLAAPPLPPAAPPAPAPAAITPTAAAVIEAAARLAAVAALPRAAAAPIVAPAAAASRTLLLSGPDQVSRRLGTTNDFTVIGTTGRKQFLDVTLPATANTLTYEIRALRSTRTGPPAQFLVRFGQYAPAAARAAA